MKYKQLPTITLKYSVADYPARTFEGTITTIMGTSLEDTFSRIAKKHSVGIGTITIFARQEELLQKAEKLGIPGNIDLAWYINWLESRIERLEKQFCKSDLMS